MEKIIGLYEYDYSIMIVADLLKEYGNKYDSYEQMYEDAVTTYEAWSKSEPNYEIDWITSLTEYIKKEEE
jgi:ribosomal protein S24E